MPGQPDYLGLSKRFASLATRATDPLLANSYRKLSETYRALDFWHEKFKRRYEPIADGAMSPKPEASDRGR
jgi:hypothetical protein